MVGINPRDKRYIITFKPKDQRPNQSDDKFEIFRNAIGLADVRDILDLTRYTGDHMSDPIEKTQYTVTDINSYKLPMIMAHLTQDQANRLRKNPNIKYVEEDGPMYKTAEMVAWQIPSMRVSPAWDPPLSARGAGVNVAVLDDGILPHNDLAPNPKINQSFVEADPRTFVNTADNTHGTSCGGIIAAKIRNGIGIAGIAPDCNLWNMRIAYDPARPPPNLREDNFVGCSIEACAFCLQNGCHAISQSYATGTLYQAFADAYRACIIDGDMICAASAGNNPQRLTFVFPAAFAGVNGISAMNPQLKNLADFSTFGPHVDFTAPGDWGTWSLGPNNTIADFAGTSASCPCFIGAAVVALSAYAPNGCPPYKPGVGRRATVEIVLANTADKLGFVGAGPPGTRDERYGWGNPQVDKAVATLKGVLPSAVQAPSTYSTPIPQNRR